MPAPEAPPEPPVDPALLDPPTQVNAVTEPVPLVPPSPGYPSTPPTPYGQPSPGAPVPPGYGQPPAYGAPPAYGSPPVYGAPPAYGSPPQPPVPPVYAPPSAGTPPYQPPAYAPPPPGSFPPGVAPPSSPESNTAKGCLKPALIVVAILVVLGAVVGSIAFFGTADSVLGSGGAPTDAYKVDVVRCSQEANGDPVATVELTNTSSDRHSFKVQVGFFSNGDPVGREVFDSTGSLDPGEQSSLDLIGFTEPAGSFTCRVTQVGYLGG